jgi:SAM-dependent methyltransferase
MSAGARGWDDYAPFYDWENARTMGRRDVGYWTRFVRGRRGRVLELGCGTGRLLLPLAREARRVCGIDLSAEMLARASVRAARRERRVRPAMIRGDMRRLPFDDAAFSTVIAPYGVLQSLTDDADLSATLRETARVMKPGARLGIDLVPDLTSWASYQKQVRFRGTLSGEPVVLVESVRQKRHRGLTIFDEDFRVGRGRTARRHQFTLTFRTVPMEDMVARLSSAGFVLETLQGSYRGATWHPDAGVWLIHARRK